MTKLVFVSVQRRKKKQAKQGKCRDVGVTWEDERVMLPPPNRNPSVAGVSDTLDNEEIPPPPSQRCAAGKYCVMIGHPVQDKYVCPECDQKVHGICGKEDPEQSIRNRTICFACVNSQEGTSGDADDDTVDAVEVDDDDEATDDEATDNEAKDDEAKDDEAKDDEAKDEVKDEAKEDEAKGEAKEEEVVVVKVEKSGGNKRGEAKKATKKVVKVSAKRTC